MLHLRKVSALVGVAAGGALLAAAVASHPVSAQGTAPSGDAARGKVAFTAKGCYECHGTLGQGNRFSGPKIAPHPVDYAAFIKQLRTPRSQMPSYSAAILPDATVADIYAYLSSIAVGKTAKEIPILAAVDTGNAGKAPKAVAASAADAAHGKTLYGANCASCHGATGQGGVGPSLKNEKSRKNFAEAVAWIKDPQPPMPKLYPATLNEKDVADVAAFVESL